ncbi:class I SAM-dependent methyltransferase [Hamadaea tsunoensis]|uniref:class I SAM-dependent methyltransferase n=1 Tax=Hamadaea tsunoensis TaxID=53368 RepID=UPI000416D974|nr:class I SAM-dependent methyltransferase [Hamadaea tsunoensis]
MTGYAFLAETADSYSRLIAADSGGDIVSVICSDPERQPWDVALLGVFARRIGGARRVLDVGCGPGQMTALLAGLGVDAFGIDLAPGMVERARRDHPELRFEVGSMLDLDLPDASVDGILACYSIIHVPHELRPQVFAEFFRVLAPGGGLMLIFQVGDEVSRRTEAFGMPIAIDWYRQQPADLAELLRSAGFELSFQGVRAPENGEKTPHGYLIAVRPAAA